MNSTLTAHFFVPTAPWPGASAFHPVLLLKPGDVFEITIARGGSGHFGADGVVYDDSAYVVAFVKAGAFQTDINFIATLWEANQNPYTYTDRVPGKSVTNTVTVNGGSVLTGNITNYPTSPPFYAPLHYNVSIPNDVGIPAYLGLTTGSMLSTDENGNPWGGPNNPAPSIPYLASITVTLHRNGPAPERPPLFTDETKDKLREAANEITKLARGLDALNLALNPEVSALKAMNWLASELARAIEPHVGSVNGLIQTALAMAKSAETAAPALNPVTWVLGTASAIDKLMILLLKKLADDPPDGNFAEVYQAPDWNFAHSGASAAGNAVVADAWRLLQSYAEMLAAAERRQGAELAGDAASMALQDAAYDAALARALAHEQTAAANLAAFHAELVALGIPDADLANDTSLATAQDYAAGLNDPADDPFIAELIAGLASGYLLSAVTAAAAAQAALDALAAATADPVTGSALAHIAAAAAALAGRGQGGDGDDILTGGDGTDLFDGGAGVDYIAGGASGDVILGGAGGDALHGQAGNDAIAGQDGDDVLIGGSGNDRLLGGAGNDTIIGDDGDDPVGGNDQLFGGDGIDQLFGYIGDDSLEGGGDGDFLSGGAGDDTIEGGDGDDAIHGEGGNDTMNAGNGNDVLVGYDGNDSLNGDAGNDTIIGNQGADTLNGGDGNDQIFGYEDADTANGGIGDDFIAGGAGSDVLHGDDGGDVLDGEDDDDQLFGDDGGDNLNGNSGNDTLFGGAGNDGLLGHDGNDVLDGGEGNDFLIGDRADGTGARGNDTFVFRNGTGNDNVADLQAGAGVGDVIDIRDFGFANFNAVLAAATDVANGIYIQLDADDAILIEGRAKGQLAADDFQLA